MLTLFHAPMSRSTRLVTLIDELGARDSVNIRVVTVARRDGSGGADADNPHPEKKVPALDHDGTVISESIAIALHLCDLFPKVGLVPPVGTVERATCLQWLAWNAGVVEPVLVAKLTGAEHPGFQNAFRGWDDVIKRLETALGSSKWLVGDTCSVADIIVHSSFSWMPDLLPDHPGIQDWHKRMMARPSVQRSWQEDQAILAPAS